MEGDELGFLNRTGFINLIFCFVLFLCYLISNIKKYIYLILQHKISTK